MKKILIFIWLSIFIQCQVQEKDSFAIPVVNSSSEKFDIKILKQKNRLDTFFLSYNNESTIVRQLQDQSYGFIDRVFYQKTYFTLIKKYYRNKNIKDKGISFNEGSPIGIWYHFDETGKLIKEENTDEGYTFTPEDLVKYCKKNNIELSKGYHESEGYQTSVYKSELNGKKVWKISYLISFNKQEKEVKLTLDGQTGKVIKREEFPYDSY